MAVEADAVQPLLAVTTTEYVPALEMVFVADVVPSFQRYVPPPEAVSVMLVVVQFNTLVLDAIEAVGAVVLDKILVETDAVQPLLAVTITEYVPAEETVFVANVVPSFQRYVPPPEAVSVMLVVVQFNTIVLDAIEAVGAVVLDETLVEADAVQPLLAVTITEYVPALEIVFVADVLASFQRYVPPPEAVRVMLVVMQFNTVVLDAIETVGAVVLDETVVEADAVQPLLAVTTTEYVPAAETTLVADVVPSFQR
jgi:hypothetical protein